jgi:hypothetical protein
MTGFNSVRVPRQWVVRILTDEHDDLRFEHFANAAASVLEGRPILSTSRSWDLGRDGRGFGPAFGVYVLATLREDADKPKTDAARLRETAKPKRVYYITSQPLSEHALRNNAEAVRTILGSTVEVETLGAIQLADLVSTGKAADAFEETYGGEVGALFQAVGGLGERPAHLQNLEFALATFGATNSKDLRGALAERVVLTLLEGGALSSRAIATGASELLGVAAFSESAVRFYCEGLSERGLIEKTRGEYRMTEAGRQAHSQAIESAASRELSGRAAVRAVVEDSLSRNIPEKQWSAIWLSLQTELARAFYLRGRQLLDLVLRHPLIL